MDLQGRLIDWFLYDHKIDLSQPAKSAVEIPKECESYSKLSHQNSVKDVAQVSLLLILKTDFTYCFGVSIGEFGLIPAGLTHFSPVLHFI